jgi:hypothetical protein
MPTKQPKRSKHKGRSISGKAQRPNTQSKNKRITRSVAARNTLDRVNSVVRRMRSDGLSLRKAAQESRVAPRTVLKQATSALRRTKSGRYAAKKNDRQVRLLMIPTPQGPTEIEVRGLKAASLLGRYWAAVHKYYETGDKSVEKFNGEFITAADGTKYPLLTDPDVLDSLGSAGVLSFESLYAGGNNA